MNDGNGTFRYEEIKDARSALDDAGRMLREMERRREARRRAALIKPNGKLEKHPQRNRTLHDYAHVKEPIGNRGAELWICYTPGREEWQQLRKDPRVSEFMTGFLDPDALNGYVAFPRRSAPKLPKETGNIVQYIPVHGGVSYAVRDAFACVWGFDTMHHKSEDMPRTDPDWIRYQCHILYSGLEVAEQLWPRFRREGDNGRRAAMVDKLLAVDPARTDESLVNRLGFEALCNLLIGRIG